VKDFRRAMSIDGLVTSRAIVAENESFSIGIEGVYNLQIL